MIALILAGGRGTRLHPNTQEIPKPLLEINGKAILGYQIETLIEAGITEVVIVTGFLKEKIEEYIKEKYPDANVSFVHNSEFENSRPAYGLIKALPKLIDDTIYLNGDVRYDPNILREIMSSSTTSATAIQKAPWDEEQVKVVVKDGLVIELSKNIGPSESSGEFIGVSKLNKAFINTIKDIVENEGKETFRHSFAIDLLNHAIHKKTQNLFALDVSLYEAIEIDTPEDLENARKKFEAK